MTSDKFHWVANPDPNAVHGGTIDQMHLLGSRRPVPEPAAAILSQYRAHLDLMVKMQQAGYVYCGEDIGVFGIHRAGPGIAARLDNLALWSETLPIFDVPAIEAAGYDPSAVFFAGLAYRMVWQIHWDIEHNELSLHGGSRRGSFDAPSAWHFALIKAYNAVVSAMDIRTILPSETGVLYADAAGKPRVLWAFDPLELTLPQGAVVRDILTGVIINARSALVASRHHVYAITYSNTDYSFTLDVKSKYVVLG